MSVQALPYTFGRRHLLGCHMSLGISGISPVQSRIFPVTSPSDPSVATAASVLP